MTTTPAIGVDVGGTKVLGVALAPAGQVLAEARRSTPQGAVEAPVSAQVAGAPLGVVADEVADVVVDLVAELTAAVEDGPGVRSTPSAPPAPPAPPAPVGLGVAGMVDQAGRLRFAPNLPGARGADFARLLTGRLGVPVVVENDANCAAVAEHRLGAAAGLDHFLMVTLGTGIGGGLVVDGCLVRGAHGFAGEIGHMVVDRAGPPCPCGGRGCWERYASGAGLGRLAREAASGGRLPEVVLLAGGDAELVRGEHVAAAAAAGDGGALAVVEELGWWVALGLANLTAVTDPRAIVVGGGLAGMGEVLFQPVRRAFAALLEGGTARPAVGIVPAAFGERSGAVGAALAAAGGGLA